MKQGEQHCKPQTLAMPTTDQEPNKKKYWIKA
jgi:hypothetical protein